MQDLALSKVHEQKPIVVCLREISENETRRPKHRAINSTRTLLAKARIFASQFQKIDMQIVKFAISFALGKIQFAPGKHVRIIRRRQSFPCSLPR